MSEHMPHRVGAHSDDRGTPETDAECFCDVPMTDHTEDWQIELFKFASLVGCEPKDEERHRKQLLDYVLAHEAASVRGAILSERAWAYRNMGRVADGDKTWVEVARGRYERIAALQGPEDAGDGKTIWKPTYKDLEGLKDFVDDTTVVKEAGL